MTTKLTREDAQLLFANNKKQDTLKTFINLGEVHNIIF